MRSFVEMCLHQRWVVVGLAVLFTALSARSLTEARFDAFPEFAGRARAPATRAASKTGARLLALCRAAGGAPAE